MNQVFSVILSIFSSEPGRHDAASPADGIPVVSLSWLALRRFVRGVIKPVAYGCVALAIILNLTAPAVPNSDSSSIELSAQPPGSRTEVDSQSKELLNLGSKVDALKRAGVDHARTLQSYRLLGASLTQHRMTSARFSRPEAPSSAITKEFSADVAYLSESD